MFGLDYAKIAVLIVAVALGAYIAHHWDKGVIEHQKGLVTAEKLKSVNAQKQALEWGMSKQKEYDDAAIAAAQAYAAAERDRGDRMERRLADVPPATVLVRGCLTYEFVRALDGAIANRAASTLPIPAGKSNDACAPVDAAAVARWLLGIIDAAQHNAGQLDALIAYVRKAQALR